MHLPSSFTTYKGERIRNIEILPSLAQAGIILLAERSVSIQLYPPSSTE
jgi:hypothetical protein